jgi:rod shape determining protein RodA
MLNSRWRYFDLSMLITTGVLMAFGCAAVWSAMGAGPLTFRNGGVQQAIFGCLGVMAMLVIASFDYRFLGSLAWILYGGGLVMLVGVLVAGRSIYGAKRWFDLGFTTVQPSEFGKLATLVALAWFISSRGSEMQSLGNLLVSMVIPAVPAFLVFREPDLGSAMCYMAMWAAMLLVTRTRIRYLVGMVLLAVPTAIFAYEFVLQPYQRDRILIALDPSKDSTNKGYNIIQAKISIGSGGLSGFGLRGGTQSTNDLLKVRESDFIFAHASGMFGFIGMCAVFICYVVLLWRCIRVAETAKDQFGQCLAIGVAGLLFFQVFVNVGMNLAILPVTGITLPFISQGSSSVVTFLAAQGILQSILMRHRKLGFQSD